MSSAQCLGQAIWHEARGEPTTTQKAVWQVVRNRARIFNKTICQVVRQKGQFPWARHLKSWKLSQEQLTLLFEVVKVRPVVSGRVVYFNRKPHKWGKHTRKLGMLYFSE